MFRLDASDDTQEHVVNRRQFCMRAGALMCAAITPGLLLAKPHNSLRLFTEEWPPITYSDNGHASGMAVEIVREMLRRAGSTDTIEVVPWARGYSLVTNQPNVGLFAMGRTQERERLVTMIGPLAIARTQLFSRLVGTRYATLDQAKQDALVGTYRSTNFEATLRQQNFAHLDLSDSPRQSAQKLVAGHIDLWCDSNLVYQRILHDIGATTSDITTAFTLESFELHLGLSRGTDPSLLDALEKGLREMKADGTYSRIYHTWLPNEDPPLQTIRVGLGASQP